jgi:hypothetical protein
MAARNTGETRKVSGSKMFRKTKEFGRDFKKPTFLSSSPLTPATQSVSRRCPGWRDGHTPAISLPIGGERVNGSLDALGAHQELF